MMLMRNILILQGPPGSFFIDIANKLRKKGHNVHRVNLNGGDLFDWKLKGQNYRGSPQDWPAFLARFIVRRHITDLILFGDCRPLHRAARATAEGLGVVTHVFEEGYVRPDWITLERGGVNGFSTLSTDPDWYRRMAKLLPDLDERPGLPEAFTSRARAALAYYTAAILLTWAFPQSRTHRPWHPLREAFGWAARLCRRNAAIARSIRQSVRLERSPYFLLPLQLDSDYQLRAHSDFDGMQPAIARALASFARHAPADVKLVVKEHPLDNGLSRWRRRTLDYARAVGVEHRVVFMEVGDIDLLVQSARGLVTVNSTTGTLALQAKVPVFTMGRAIYDMPGLTHQGTLEEFWCQPERPCLDLYRAFRRVLVHTCLLHGGFYDVSGRSTLVAEVSDRILNGPPCFLHPERVSPSQPQPAQGVRHRLRLVKGPTASAASLTPAHPGHGERAHHALTDFLGVQS